MFLARPRKARHLYWWGDGQQLQVTFVDVTIGRFFHSERRKKEKGGTRRRTKAFPPFELLDPPLTMIGIDEGMLARGELLGGNYSNDAGHVYKFFSFS